MASPAWVDLLPDLICPAGLVALVFLLVVDSSISMACVPWVIEDEEAASLDDSVGRREMRGRS